MTVRSGPQLYPGANTVTYWYEGDYAVTAMEVNVLGLHTTEGTSVPTYADSQGRRGASAPNLTAAPDFKAGRLRWYQHFRIDSSARALANRYGGVETNTLNVCQVELIGTCDPATRMAWQKRGLVQDKDFIFWPEAPDWALRDLAEFVAWLHTEHGVPLSGPAKWPPYPTSYGTAGGQRMTGAQWSSFRGVCGHMHVPENDHGDPGAIDFAGLLERARAVAGATVPPAAPPPPAPAGRPVVSLAHIRAAQRRDPGLPQGGTTYKAEALVVEDALYRAGLLAKRWVDGSLGSRTLPAVSAWQERCGFRGRQLGQPADGYFGKDSLTRLGKAYGFDVKD